MKLFRLLLLLLALAALGAFAWQSFATDDSQVIVSLHDAIYTTTVPKALLMLAIALVALWVLLWLLRLPFRLWHRHRHRQQRARLAGGLLALHEGRWQRAEKSLEHAASDPAMRLPARLGAARAARERGDRTAAERHLQAASGDDGDVDVALARADDLFQQGRATEAIGALDAATQTGALPPRALVLRAHALAASARANDAYGMLGSLRAAQALSDTDYAALELRLAQQSLAEAPDANALADRWDRLLAPLRAQPSVVAAYAERASMLQLEDAAASAVESALKSHWSEDLALLFGRLPFGRLTSNTPSTRMTTAESWQRAHSDSPALGITLGRLSLQQQQLSKAEGYLHRAIAQGGGSTAWEELGNAHAAQGDDARARQCYANALHVARGEPAEELPGRGIKDRIFDESVIEERSELGVPRLPAG